MSERGDLSGFGMSEKKIRKMQEQVARKVDTKKAEDAEILSAMAKERDFREASEHNEMDKGDLARSSRARK